jgi:hypothetical protein
MKNKFWFSVAFLGFFSTGCAAMMMTGEERYGKSVPIITESFASKGLIPADTWKVYLKASDPDGDMSYIVSTLYQVGWGDYPVSRTRIREEDRKELNGYIYLNTLIPGGYEFLNFSTIWLTVQIQDKAGHFSKPVEFALTFNKRAIQEMPAPGVFKEEDLGPILVNLHPFDTGDGGFQ